MAMDDKKRYGDMKLKKLLQEINFDKKVRAGLLPYTYKDGKIYVALMIPSDSEFGGDKPQIAKGGIDSGESPEQTAMREGKEELGYIHKSHYKLNKIYEENNITWFCVKVDSIEEFKKPGFETKKVVWLQPSQAFSQIRIWQKPILNKVIEVAKMNLNEMSGISIDGHTYHKLGVDAYVGEEGILGPSDHLISWSELRKMLIYAKKKGWK